MDGGADLRETKVAEGGRRAEAVQSNPRLEGLDFLWLEITPGCNLHCRHCYTKSSPLLKDPKIVDWEKVLKDAYQVGCRQVQFIGGEPTYGTPLLQYVSTARKLGYTFVEVYSNLTLVSETLANQFRRYRVQLATSFYSSNKEAHDAVTGVEGSFDKTVRGIRCVLRKRIPLRVGLIAMETNESEVRDCIDFLVGIGIERNNIRVDHTRPVGRGEDLVKLQSLEETLCGHCWDGKLAVSWDGTCYPCVFSRAVAVGTLRTNSLDEVLHSERLEQFRKRIFNYSSRFAPRIGGQDLFSSLLTFFSGIRANEDGKSLTGN
jgi:MoaA/NifB/PqqE/SkfB family radical SAM enzyme